MAVYSAKSLAKQKQSRKYGSRRKADANGSGLRHLGTWRNGDGDATIECDGGMNPIEKYLGIVSPNGVDITSKIASILQHTKPTEIKFEKINHIETFSRWSIYYRYSTQQQYEQYLANVRKEKEWKKASKEFVKATRLRTAKERHQSKKKEYSFLQIHNQLYYTR